ncbi:hypothetical protein AB0M39_16995 [Streptomyces sp. NPDC051907]|uniref:hypothetical protein n=1 Tax=Streptomyces sp. NPDC051907 TaxID=3155284 RepID=UPI0034390217
MRNVRRFLTPQVAVATGLALVVGGFSGYMIAETIGDADSSRSARPCSDVVSNSHVREAMGRVVRSGESVTSNFSEKSSSGKYVARCTVAVDGRVSLIVAANLEDSGDVEQWLDTLAQNKDIGDEEDRRRFDVGEEGISAESSAAIYLKCTSADPKVKKNFNLSILVTSLSGGSSASERRVDLADIATSMANHAQKSAQCSDPVKIPDRAPPLSS